MVEQIKKYKKRIYVLSAILVAGVPFLIHCLFKLHIGNDFLIAEWSAGDILLYYGTMLLGVVTIYLAYVAVKQTQIANDTNNRLLKINEMERKVFLKLNLCECEIKNENNIKFVSIYLENMTNNVIIDCDIKSSDKLLVDTNWSFDQESKNGIVVTKFESITGNGLIEEDKKLKYTLAVKKYKSPFLLISFKTISKSIYGLETIQYYNIIFINESFLGYKTLVEE